VIMSAQEARHSQLRGKMWGISNVAWESELAQRRKIAARGSWLMVSAVYLTPLTLYK
jgi:hypothetical protein